MFGYYFPLACKVSCLHLLESIPRALCGKPKSASDPPYGNRRQEVSIEMAIILAALWRVA